MFLLLLNIIMNLFISQFWYSFGINSIPIFVYVFYFILQM